MTLLVLTLEPSATSGAGQASRAASRCSSPPKTCPFSRHPPVGQILCAEELGSLPCRTSQSIWPGDTPASLNRPGSIDSSCRFDRQTCTSARAVANNEQTAVTSRACAGKRALDFQEQEKTEVRACGRVSRRCAADDRNVPQNARRIHSTDMAKGRPSSRAGTSHRCASRAFRRSGRSFIMVGGGFGVGALVFAIGMFLRHA
jgi:hypothetical protein